MKANIHPNYVEAKVTCACGNSWTTRSTRPSLHVDLCYKCHPFYTGEQRIVDTAGQVDRFRRRMDKRRAPSTKTSAQSPVEIPAAERPTVDEAGEQPSDEQLVSR